MNKFLAGAIIAVLIVAGGVYIGWRAFGGRAEEKVNASVILTALHDQGFLVTQTYVFNEPVTIERSTGSVIKDIFFGQTITARGTMEVNLGVDLSSVGENDVAIEGERVSITIPGAKLFNSRLIGPIEVRNQQGLLKRLLQNDDGYNAALAELSKQAEAAAKSPELLERANKAAREELSRLLKYVVPGKEVAVISGTIE